jgi:hypothetical protein
MRKAIIAAAAAIVAIGATPLIVAAPASAYVSCPQGGGQLISKSAPNCVS